MPKKKSPIKKILNVIVDVIIVLYLIVTLLLSLSVFSAINNDGIPSFMGYMLFTIESDSMENTMNVGDLILSKQYDKKEILNKDDIITFNAMALDNEGNQVQIKKTHRIVDVETHDSGESAYQTRGDNAPDKDAGYRVPGDIVAVYTGYKISGGGKVFNFLQSQKGILICLVVPLAIFFFWALYKFVKTIVEYRASKAGLTDEQKKMAIEEYLAQQGKQESDKEKADIDELKAETPSSDDEKQQ